MRQRPFNKDRYPGLIPFDKGQSTIFFGRDQEKKEMFYQICLEKMVVLFGKSGLGKSSLINAGVSPMLEKNGYLPVRIRFTSDDQVTDEEKSVNLLLKDFKSVLRESTYNRNILFNKESPRLWEIVKAANFNEFADLHLNQELFAWMADKGINSPNANTNSRAPGLVVPVFIFDQFEEFFHHPVIHQQEFLSQLAEIVHEESPYRILDWITDIDPDQRTTEQVNWSQQPAVKVIFSLRSDSLANMQSLVSYIPTALRNRYELRPLTSVQAEQAIKDPAQKELSPEYTAPFSFEDGTLNEIIQVLKGKTDEIESSQLQIVCNFIEDKIRRQIVNGGGSTGLIVNSSIIKPIEDFPSILDNFYEAQLNKIDDPHNREIARKLIEDDLVIDGMRDSISKNKLMSKYEISEDLIEEIQNTRLIREEATTWGTIYELSHDTLIAPVEKSKKLRLEAEEKQKEGEEKQELAILAKKNEQELIEKKAQLEKEILLRQEAEKQKAEVEKQKVEVERLAKKVKKMGTWVFVLVIIAVVCFVLYFQSSKLKLEKDLTTTRTLLVDSGTIRVNNLNQDTAFKTATGKKKDTLNYSFIKLISATDSVADANDQDNPEIETIIDSLYMLEFKKKKTDIEKFDRQQKIYTLKEYYIRRLLMTRNQINKSNLKK